jgi:hypothetical protein
MVSKNCNNFANPFSPPPQLVMMVSNPIPPFQTYNNADIQYGLSPPQVLPLCLISTLVPPLLVSEESLTNNDRKFGNMLSNYNQINHIKYDKSINRNFKSLKPVPTCLCPPCNLNLNLKSPGQEKGIKFSCFHSQLSKKMKTLT